ncbi:high-affinity choline transporter 1-like [Haemaphysalis longicornis]
MAVTLLYPTTDFTAAGYPGPFRLPPEKQHEALPYSLRYLTPHLVSLLGLAAISGAVMSSVDSSALSMASLLTRNLYLNMLRPTAGSDEMAVVVRITVFVVVLVSTVMALSVRSVYSLWSLSSDLAYILLFPQLVCLFFVTEHTNAYGVLAGFLTGIVVRLLSGEPSVKFDGLLTLPMHHTLSMLASLSVTLLVSFIFRELFARGAIRDCWRCFVVIGQDNTGRFLVKSGMKPISGPMIDQEPEGPALADGREAGTGADVRTPVCLPEEANMVRCFA